MEGAMQPISRPLLFSAMASMALVFSGCNDSGSSDDGAASAGVPSVSGSWSGIYYRTDEAAEESITASISQDGKAVVINTTKASAPGQAFTGTIETNGEMILTDGSDGETWTTHFGPATGNNIHIADFVRPPTPEEMDPPLRIVHLTR